MDLATWITCIVWVGVITCLLWAVYEVGRTRGHKKGYREGNHSFRKDIERIIERNDMLSLRFKTESGLSLTKYYDITERLDKSRSNGQIRFAEEISPTDKGDDGSNEKLAISIWEDSNLSLMVSVPADRIPKSLWGKELNAELNFLGRSLKNRTHYYTS